MVVIPADVVVAVVDVVVEGEQCSGSLQGRSPQSTVSGKLQIAKTSSNRKSS